MTNYFENLTTGLPHINVLGGLGNFIPTPRVPSLARGPLDWLVPPSNETAWAMGLGRLTSDAIPTSIPYLNPALGPLDWWPLSHHTAGTTGLGRSDFILNTSIPGLGLARGPLDWPLRPSSETAVAPLRPSRTHAARADRGKGPSPGSLGAAAAIAHHLFNRGIPRGPKDDAGAVAELLDYAVHNELPYADELTRNLGKFLAVVLEALKLPDKAPSNDAAPRGNR